MARRFLTTIQAITATFTGNVTAANPTLPQHLATKEYVDGLSSSTIVEDGLEYPSSASNGQLFYNTSNGRTAVYFDSLWKEFAYLDEVTSVDGGLYNTTTFNTSLDGGNPSQTVFVNNYDGGSY